MNINVRSVAAKAVASGLLVGLGLVSGAAHASRVSWSVGVNVAPVAIGVGNGYYAPAPVYAPAYAPAPVYVAPQPVYVAPPPVMYRPVPVYRPAPVYYGPPPGYGYYRHHHHHRDWR